MKRLPFLSHFCRKFHPSHSKIHPNLPHIVSILINRFGKLKIPVSPMTPAKDSATPQHKISGISKPSQNSNPNLPIGKISLQKSSNSKKSTRKIPTRDIPQAPDFNSNLSNKSPSVKSVASPKIGSTKSKKPSPRNPTCNGSIPNPIQETRFIISQKNSTGKSEIQEPEECGSPPSTTKKVRNRMLEEARSSIPVSGSGKVMHLVKAFESILSIPNSAALKEKEGEEADESKQGMKWALPGLRPKAEVTEDFYSSFSTADLLFASKSFDSDSGDSSSHEYSTGSIGSRTSGRDWSRRNSSGSSGRAGGRKWDKQLKVTSQQPFKLRTEQRGRSKKEEFHRKLEEMVLEEQKLRIPIAQGLPWTTDEPECLVKPPVKERTQPVDLKLHTDLRAVERAEFDHHIAEKTSLIELYRLERDKHQKLQEEEEVKRLRKELVQRAQPMPYFDKPFFPKRSMNNPTIPRGPKFHNPQHKKFKIKGMSHNAANKNILNEP